jgi:hypothetical protein
MLRYITTMILSLVLLVGVPASSFGAAGTPVIDGFLEPAGYTQDTDMAAASGLGTVPSGARLVLIQAEGDDLRWRDDGTNPTAAVGMVLAEGQTLVYNGRFADFKAIQVTAAGVMNVSWYK